MINDEINKQHPLLKQFSANTEVYFQPLKPKDLQKKIKHNESQIQNLTLNISKLRRQLKSLSLSANKMIQKKLKYPNGTKSRPNFNIIYQTKKLQDLLEQKRNLFQEIDEAKQLVNQLKNSQEPQVKFQIIKKQTALKQIQKLLIETQNEKNLIKQQLQANKNKLIELKINSNNEKKAQNQLQLQKLKKQKAIIDKHIYEINNQEITYNMYYFEIKEKYQKKQINNQKKQTKVPISQILQLVDSINQVIEQRNAIQKQKAAQINQLKFEITNLQYKNRQIQKNIRFIQSDMMKKSLQDRFYQTRLEKHSKSISNIEVLDKKYNTNYEKQARKSQSISSKFMLKKNSQIKKNSNRIQIGSYQITQNSKLLKDLTCDSSNIQKLNKISFILCQQKIVGIKPSYLTKFSKQINGLSLSIDRIQKPYQKQILLKQIKQIQFPLNSKSIAIKFHKFNGTIQTIGIQYYGPTKKVNVNVQTIKAIQLLVEKDKLGSYTKVKAIIIELNKKDKLQHEIKSQINEVQENNANAVFLTHYSKDNLEVKRSMSIDNISKQASKVILKPLKQQPNNLDHRLLIRKKLV